MKCQMHTVQLILRPTEYEKAVINKRFHAVSHIHNVVFNTFSIKQNNGEIIEINCVDVEEIFSEEEIGTIN